MKVENVRDLRFEVLERDYGTTLVLRQASSIGLYYFMLYRLSGHREERMA